MAVSLAEVPRSGDKADKVTLEFTLSRRGVYEAYRHVLCAKITATSIFMVYKINATTENITRIEHNL